ncbi:MULTISPECIES: hypothetical protein [unclassified Mesorhizobium]|uniref:hypothetical protein n=1 Tax=unclassified Mesorhizobium TaxID=325217 RepID=UPI00143F87CC|nr:MULTISPECIES: hypothetical protein [unclassified Mesorhizobium]
MISAKSIPPVGGNPKVIDASSIVSSAACIIRAGSLRGRHPIEAIGGWMLAFDGLQNRGDPKCLISDHLFVRADSGGQLHMATCVDPM